MLLFILAFCSITPGIPSAMAIDQNVVRPKPGSPDVLSAQERQADRRHLFHDITKRSGVSPNGSLTVLSITVGKSSMVDVEKTLGKSPTIVTGDAATNEGSKCYLGKDGTAVVFTSDEISPGVGGVEVYESQKASGRIECSASNQISKVVTTGVGIHLGLSRRELRGILGKPEKSSKKNDVYFWSSPLANQCQSNSFYILRYSEDRLISFQFGSHESC